jgi:anti-sigma factor ChrR (cupin superfamily)
MTDSWTGRLSDYLDGDLAAAERVALDAHLAGCSECTQTLAELRAVTVRVTRLEASEPVPDLWPGIAARIGVEDSRGALGARTRRAWRDRLWTFTLPQLAAAGFLLALLSGATVWMALNSRPSPAPDGSRTSLAARPGPLSPTTGGATVVVAGFESQRYDAAIAEMEQVLAQHRAELDSSTVRIIEQNLAVIDQATDQARRALAADPANPYLNGHLAEQMRRKVDLLRQATALVSAHG